MKAGALLAAEALGAIVIGSIAAATSFQDHMTKATAIMGDLTDSVRKQLEQSARDVAKTTLFSANEAADAYYYLASAGYTAQQSIGLLPVVAEFAQAGMIDLQTATEQLTQVQTTLGLRSQDAAEDLTNMTRVTDVLTLAAVESQATMEELAKALNTKVGAQARQLGKPMEEVTAALMVLADQGVKGAVAGTGLSIVLRDLQTKAIKNEDAFKKFGVSVFDNTGKMRNLSDIIGDLEGALDGMSDKQKKATLIQMGFTDRSVGFILALLGTSDAMRQYEKDLRSASGFTHEVAQKQLDSFASGLTILWHWVNEVAIAIGEKLLPGMQSFVEGAANWLDANEDLIVSIVDGLLGAIGAVVGFIFDQLGPAFKFVGDKIGIVVGFVHEFMDAWDEVFGKVETISTKVGGFMESMGEPVEKLNTNMHGFLESVEGTEKKVNPFVGALKAMKEKIEDIGDLLRPIIDKMQEYNVIGLILAGTITGILGGALIALIAWLLPFVAIATAVVGATLLISEAWKAWGDGISGAVGDALNWLATEVLPELQRAVEGVSDWVSDHKDEILEFFGNLGDVGKTAFDVIVTAIQIAWPILVGLAEVVLPALGVAADLALKAMNTMFEILGGVWDWLSDRFDEIGDAMDTVGVDIDILTPIINGLVLLITGALAAAFVGWLLGLARVGVAMAVTTVLNIGTLMGSISSLILRFGAIILALNPIGIALGIATAAWILDLGGVRSEVENLISSFFSLFSAQDRAAGGGTFSGGGSTGGAGGGGSFTVTPTTAPTTSGTTYDRRYLPTFATGTPWFGGGMAMVGERGPELVNLPRGSGVSSAGETTSMLGGMNGTTENHVHLHVQGLVEAKGENEVLRQLRRVSNVSFPLGVTPRA